jgi:hypothetical protein
MLNRGHVEAHRSINSRIASERRPRRFGGCRRRGGTPDATTTPGHSSNDVSPAASPDYSLGALLALTGEPKKMMAPNHPANSA